MRCESDTKLLIVYMFCIFRAIGSGPPGAAHGSLPLASKARPAGGCPGSAIAPLRRRPHCVRWRPSWSWLLAVLELMTTARLDSPDRPAPLSLRFAVRQVNRAVCKIPVYRFWPEGHPSRSLPLLLGEEEPGLKGAERGGYSPIPRRDARAGVRCTSKC